MKRYRVFYTIKMDSTLYDYYLDVEAGNKKEAIKQVRETVFNETGRNAFTPRATSKSVIPLSAIEGLPPKKLKGGINEETGRSNQSAVQNQ